MHHVLKAAVKWSMPFGQIRFQPTLHICWDAPCTGHHLSAGSTLAAQCGAWSAPAQPKYTKAPFSRLRGAQAHVAVKTKNVLELVLDVLKNKEPNLCSTGEALNPMNPQMSVQWQPRQQLATNCLPEHIVALPYHDWFAWIMAICQK